MARKRRRRYNTTWAMGDAWIRRQKASKRGRNAARQGRSGGRYKVRWIKRALGTKRRRGVRRGHHRKRFRVEARRKGALHRALGVPMGEKIPLKKLRRAARRGGRLGKMARFALTARKFRHRRRRG